MQTTENNHQFDITSFEKENTYDDDQVQTFRSFRLICDEGPTSTFDGRFFSDWMTLVDGQLYIPAEDQDVEYLDEADKAPIDLIPMEAITLPAVDEENLSLAIKMGERLRDEISRVFSIRWPLPIVDVDGRLAMTKDDKVHSDCRFTRLRVADEDSLTPDQMNTLAHDTHWDVRQVIAFRSDLSPDILEHLSQDEDMFVRVAIAENKSLTGEIVSKMSHDPMPNVRGRIARHPLLSAKDAERLAKDDTWSVRHEIATRSDLSPKLISMLQNDDDFVVRKTINSNTETSIEMGL